ncbi:hypothetical protein LUZ60_016224 [Juncus effusus]|nr:hypothetical protein LUZ60_016224 [Juncus effusus]
MRTPNMSERWAGMASAVASFMFLWAMGKQFIPIDMQGEVTSLANKVISFIDPYDHITIPQSDGDSMEYYMLYIYAEAYLGYCCSNQAHNLKLVEFGEDTNRFSVTVDTNEDVMDEYLGIKIWWVPLEQSQLVGLLRGEVRRKYLRVSFHKMHRQIVVESYFRHVLEEGRTIRAKNRKQMLFTNEPSSSSSSKRVTWKHMAFQHPSTFDTLAMDYDKKNEIINDLVAFREGTDYYSRIGKVWKRGYLLYGPPGTGKSSLIAAIANFLKYDVYDLELTAVKSNVELRNLFIQTTGKSIIVIEDIDCSLEFTRKRKFNKAAKSKTDVEAKIESLLEEEEASKVTLSGILNVIDGLWSSCSGEKIIIFTTNHMEKLDAALIRKGRMDKFIEMSYCGFDAFKVLAKNYLDITDHHLFGEIHELLQETRITTADMAENLMVKSVEVDVEACLRKLIKTLNAIKTGNEADNWVRLV